MRNEKAMTKRAIPVPSVKLAKEAGRGSRRLAKVRRQVPYLVMLVIPAAFYLVFQYWPMFGFTMAFQDYKAGAPFLGPNTSWTGLKWFIRLFENPMFGRLIRNTLLLSVIDMLVTFPASIALALLLRELRSRRMRNFTTNISLLPYFISTTVIIGIMFNIFSVDKGIINQIIESMGGGKIDFMGSSEWFRAMYVGSDVWQSTGFSAVVFTAAISGIDPTLYEAAALDGSTRFQNIFRITLPCIMPTIAIMLILRVGGLMSVGYEKIILMYSPGTYEVADTLNTYAYRAGILDGKISLSTAIGLFNSVCNLALLASANWISKRISGSGI